MRTINSRAILALLVALEITLFSVIGTNFWTMANAFEVTRLSVEIGLISLALTPVIVSGGIDLSVGSMMGLSAVVFGKLWRDVGLSIEVAALCTLLAGAIGGFLNAVLITRLRAPSLIVTLGTLSLFRGLAEGITGGVDNFTHFPASFLFLGQGYLSGGIPAQLPILLFFAFGFWFLLHRSILGRGLEVIGFSPDGARYAGISVNRHVGLVFLLSGLFSSIAALIYVAHLGQAKADAGTSYELLAITAVVLGGTSIFGGRGSISGTILGLIAIAILKNGLLLADLPAELAGVLTGALLLLAIGLDSRFVSTRNDQNAKSDLAHRERLNVKNTQVAVICLAILGAGLLVAGSNFLLIKNLVGNLNVRAPSDHSAPRTTGGSSKPDTSRIHEVTVAMMPKSKGNSYFIACKKGAEEAAREFHVNLLWDGPTDPDPSKQNEIVDTWITRGVDVIAVAVENRQGISSALRKARSKGIKVITWDADSEADARDFFVNQATPEGIGRALMDHAAQAMGNQGEFAIITASLTASNMNEWQKQIEKRRLEKYPDIKMAALRPCDDLQKKAFDEANTILNAYPKVKLIMSICTPAVPGAAEAVKQSGRKDVKVVGLGLPNDNKRYVHEGITDTVILWNTTDLGYLTVKAARALKEGDLKAGDRTVDGGRLGQIAIETDNILLGQPFAFTKENIDGFDF